MGNTNAKDFLKKSNHRKEKFESLSDEIIIKKVSEGNSELFEIITKRYNQQLFRIIRGYLNNRQDIEDVMQTTYLKAYDNLTQFRGDAQFSTWLIRIAINEALKKQKGQNRVADLHSVTNDQNGDQNNSAERHTPESKMIRNDMDTHLEKAIDALPPKYRSVLIMREIEQLSTKETAKVLDISQSNVKVRLHRAKNMLRDHLTDMLDEIDLFSFKGKDCDRMTDQVMRSIREKE